MISRRTKALTLFAGIIGFSAALVLGVLLFARNGPVWAAVLWGLVWGVAVVATLLGLIGFLRETDPGLAPGDLHVVTAPPTPLPPETDRKNPWPHSWLAPALADAFDGTPYVVRSDGHAILVHADLADARWQHLASLHHLEVAFVARLTPTGTPGVLKRTDESRRVEAHATTRRLGAQVAIRSGRQFGYTRRSEYGLGLDGLKKRVDYEFTTAEINQPVSEVLRRAGWRSTLDAETKGAIVMAGLGASALVLVPVALGISALLS